MEDYVVVGLVGRAHGIGGEVLVEPRTDEPERRFVAGARLDVRGARADQPRSVTVAAVRRHRGRLLVRFEQIDDRTAAEAARGWQLTVPIDPDETPEDPEEFYDHQLVGLRVEDEGGHVLGMVRAVEHTGAQDLLHIARSTGGDAVLFPFVAVLVPEVDPAGGRIVVDDRPGLLVEES